MCYSCSTKCLCQTYNKPAVRCSANLAGVQDTSRLDFDDFMKVMDHMQKSNIPQTRKQAGFTDDEVTVSEQQYYCLDTSISIQKITDPIITSFITQAQAYGSLMLGTLSQGFVGGFRGIWWPMDQGVPASFCKVWPGWQWKVSSRGAPTTLGELAYFDANLGQQRWWPLESFRFFDWKRFVEQRIKLREIKGEDIFGQRRKEVTAMRVSWRNLT